MPQSPVADRQAHDLFDKTVSESATIDNPLAAYAQFAGRVMAWLELMDSLLDGLDSATTVADNGAEQVRATVILYERAMDRANTVLSSYARLRIDERLTAITEQQAKTMVRAIEAVIALLGADPEQATAARAVAARHLRAV